MPLDQRETDSPTYHDVLFETPEGPLATALDKWAMDALKRSGKGRITAERLNVLAGAEVISTSQQGAHYRAQRAGLLMVVDLLIHVLDEEINDTQVRPHRNYESSGSKALMLHLVQLLTEGRSVWQIGRLPDLSWGLVRRVDEAATERAATVMSPDSLATSHLRRAWSHTYRRTAEPKQALDEVILAIESAARSVVSPNDKAATLGKMISALRDKPDKWSAEVGTIEQLAERLSALWKAQPRHGVDDPNEIKHVSPAFAEAAVHEGLTLVHWFRTGFVRME